MNEKSKKVKEAKINKKSHITLHTSQNKGITLVALIITIIVLLILAVVAIRAVQGDGIISHAKNARAEYEKGQAQESSILSSYEIELAKNSPASLSNEMTSTKFAKTIFVKDEKGKTFVVPAGYTIVKDDTTANTVEVDKGVVITDEISEFVWVPVNNINTMAKVTSGTDANGRTNYRGVLYNWYTDATGNTAYEWSVGSTSLREPDVVLKELDYSNLPPTEIDGGDNNTDNLDIINTILGTNYGNANDFLKNMQEEYNSMVESVAKYGGFYVGRYEMSLNASGNAQSKSGETSATAASDSANTWYGLYAKAKTYTNAENSVVSNMIYGSQYDAMMKWMQSNGIDVTSSNPKDTTGITASKNGSGTTGAKGSTDKLNNVYDLLGNILEWTQEASNTNLRVFRGGGYYTYNDSPSIRNPIPYYPTNASSYGSSRLSLYIR